MLNKTDIRTKLRSHIEKVLNGLIEQIFKEVQEYFRKATPCCKEKCPKTSTNACCKNKGAAPGKATTTKPVAKAIATKPAPKPVADSKKVVVKKTLTGFSAVLPDGQTWTRARERDLLLKIRKAGFYPTK